MNQKPTPTLHPDWIDPEALEIIQRLQSRGHTTYLVGGCVRDLLLGYQPKDFDIATMARPGEVKRAVPFSYIIGKRFRLVLVKRGEKQFEIATFRRDVRDGEDLEHLGPGDNIFGTPEDDARRRDFTINGMFYDPVGNALIDWTEGKADLAAGRVRMIGEPEKRLVEDPIRILRAIRLAHMIRFSLDPELKDAIVKTSDHLPQTALPRRREELLKFLRLRNPAQPFLETVDLGILETLAPNMHRALSEADTAPTLIHYLTDIHTLPAETPTELFAPLVLGYYRAQMAADPEAPVRAKSLLEDPKLGPLMRDELGMFKSEQVIITSAIQLMGLLQKRSAFEKRGQTRQKLILTNEAFPLALQLAKRDHLLSPSDLWFWLEKYESARNTAVRQEPSSPASPVSQTRRRRRRRRRPA